MPGMSAEEHNTKLIDFLKLFVVTNREQRLGLLHNISSEQCDLIRQAAYNILFNSSLILLDKDKNYFKKHIGAIKRLASKRICLEKRRPILVKHHLVVKRIATIALDYLS